MAHVVIAGAGISGLAVAHFLQRFIPHVNVTIVDSTSRVGGCVATHSESGFTIEAGPNGFLDGKPNAIALSRDLGLSERLVAANEGSCKNRFLFLNQKIQRLPGNIPSFLSSALLSIRGKLRLLAEPFVRRGQQQAESVAAFARRRFGREAADVFIDALVTGIHAGDPDLLDVRAAFPRLAKYEATAGSVIRGVLRTRASRQRMWSFPTGLHELTNTLAAQLTVPPILSAGIRSIEPTVGEWTVHGDGLDSWTANAVVLACPAHAQAPILEPLDNELASLLASIPYNRIAVVALGYRVIEVPKQYDGFGFIAPQNTRRDLLGVQWCSSIFPDRAPLGMVLWRALCGGWNRPEVVDWTDEKLVAAVAAELRMIHGVTVPPAFVKIIRWRRAIPQYTLGHPERVAAIDARTRQHAGLFLTGNSFRGIALNDCIEDAERVAMAVADYIRPKG